MISWVGSDEKDYAHIEAYRMSFLLMRAGRVKMIRTKFFSITSKW